MNMHGERKLNFSLFSPLKQMSPSNVTSLRTSSVLCGVRFKMKTQIKTHKNLPDTNNGFLKPILFFHLTCGFTHLTEWEYPTSLFFTASP